MAGMTRSNQYKYSSAVRNAHQVVTAPATMTRLQVPYSVLPLPPQSLYDVKNFQEMWESNITEKLVNGIMLYVVLRLFLAL